MDFRFYMGEGESNIKAVPSFLRFLVFNQKQKKEKRQRVDSKTLQTIRTNIRFGYDVTGYDSNWSGCVTRICKIMVVLKMSLWSQARMKIEIKLRCYLVI